VLGNENIAGGVKMSRQSQNSKGRNKDRDSQGKRTVHGAQAELPRPLSIKEKSVLEFLESYIRSNGVSPTYQEICHHFDFASFNSVQRYLKQLEAKGYIQLPWTNQKRAITLLQPSSAIQDAVEKLQPSPQLNHPHHQSGSHIRTAPNPPNVTPALLPAENLTLPLLGRVAAGAPIEALEYDEFIDVPASLVRHADRTYALRVQGQSMIEDGILDGDVILVQRQSTAANGEIVVAIIDEEATVKRFYLHHKLHHQNLHQNSKEESGSRRMIELRPANSSMQPMWYEPGEVQIRGVVVGLIRRFSSN